MIVRTAELQYDVGTLSCYSTVEGELRVAIFVVSYF